MTPEWTLEDDAPYGSHDEGDLCLECKCHVQPEDAFWPFCTRACQRSFVENSTVITVPLDIQPDYSSSIPW